MTLSSTTARLPVVLLIFATLVACLLVAVPISPSTAATSGQPPATSAAAERGEARPAMAPHCERVAGTTRCGLKYTNTESKVVVAAAIAAAAAGGVVACRNVAVCKILVATVGAALTTWWTAITQYDRCLFVYSTGTSSRAALVQC